MRRERFQLELGSHPRKTLQQAWNEVKGEGFTMDVVREPEKKERSRDELLEELERLTELAQQDMLAAGRQAF